MAWASGWVRSHPPAGLNQTPARRHSGVRVPLAVSLVVRLFLFVMPGAGGRTGEEQPSHMGSWRMRMRSRSTAGGSRFDSCAALHFIPERVKLRTSDTKIHGRAAQSAESFCPPGGNGSAMSVARISGTKLPSCRPRRRRSPGIPLRSRTHGRKPGAYLWAAGESGEQWFAFAAAAAFGAMAVGQPSPGRRTNLTKGRHYNG